MLKSQEKSTPLERRQGRHRTTTCRPQRASLTLTIRTRILTIQGEGGHASVGAIANAAVDAAVDADAGASVRPRDDRAEDVTPQALACGHHRRDIRRGYLLRPMMAPLLRVRGPYHSQKRHHHRHRARRRARRLHLAQGTLTRQIATPLRAYRPTLRQAILT